MLVSGLDTVLGGRLLPTASASRKRALGTLFASCFHLPGVAMGFPLEFKDGIIGCWDGEDDALVEDGFVRASQKKAVNGGAGR